ncbi:MAG: HlyD family efflux transporter periplasmic adaptor subunit [Ilumatobacteraceae bacterium]
MKPNDSLFPTEITGTAYRRRKRVRRAITTAVVVVLLAGGGLAIAQTSGNTPSRYRLATASQQEVTSTLDGVATIQPVAQADVAFPNAGTVETVSVALGDTVTAGQVLAQLNTDDLMVTVRSKEATLTKAQLILAKALDGEDVSSLTGGSAGRSYNLSPAAVERMLAALPAVTEPDGLAAARAAVASAQHDVDTALSAASTALDSATSVCSAIGVAVDPDSTDTSGIDAAVDACQSALSTVVDKQNAVQSAQSALSDASSNLDSLLAQWADDAASETTTTEEDTTTTTEPATTVTTDTSSEDSTTTTSTTDGSMSDDSSTTTPRASGGGGGGGGGGSSSGSGGSSSGSSTSSPTSSDIASYQQAVDAAASALAVAELTVAQATITSPIDGTVIAVNLAVGDTVDAGSTTATIVVQGTGGYEATTTVSLADVASIHVGAAATVLPDGSTTTFSGTVTSVSAVPTTSSSSTTSYAVAIALDGDTSTLHNGGIGSVSIVTGSSAATLAVPTSAVTTDGTQHTVDVADGTTVTTTRVEVGVVGPVWTEITSGLTEGQQVVLAELDAALPSSATSSSNSSSSGGGFGGFPGGGGRP